MTEFVVRMENRPGRLASLTEALAAYGVNIEALAAYGHNGEGTIRLIVDDAATARRVLEESALHNEERTVLTAQLPHRPGELARLTRLRVSYSDKPVVSAFYQFWHDPIFTINGDHIISAVMQLCGGRNIFSAMAVLSGQINAEAVISANPDVIIASAIDANRPPWLDYWQHWPELAAARNGQIYYIPPDLIQRHTPRILDGAAMMCEFIDKARIK